MVIGPVRLKLSTFLWKGTATLERMCGEPSQRDSRLSSSDRASNGTDVFLIRLPFPCAEASHGIDRLMLRYMTERAQFQGFRYGHMKAGVSHGDLLVVNSHRKPTLRA